jgi:hypothetical protein
MSTKPEPDTQPASLAREAAPVVEGFDPYSSVTTRVAPDKPRRTLDDMRKLSEEIKRSRAGK